MEHTTTTLMSIIIREMRDLLFKGAELMCTKPQTADERAMLDREQAEWANKTRYFLLADDATAGVNNTTAAFGEFESGDEDQEQEEDEDQDQVQDEDEDEDEDDEDEDEDVVRKETKHDYAKLPPAAIVSSSGKASYGGSGSKAAAYGGGSSGKAASAYGGGGSSGSSGSKAAAYGGGSKAVGGGTGVGGGGRINNKRKASEMELRQMTMKVEETSDGQITERSMRKLMAAFQQFDGEEEEVTAVYQKHYVSDESEEDDD